MTCKERMMRVLSGERGANPLTVFHSRGDYKVEFAGFHWKFFPYQGGAELMVEEDKNGFALDPLKIRRMLRPETCLIGNVDRTLLLRGTLTNAAPENWRDRSGT